MRRRLRSKTTWFMGPIYWGTGQNEFYVYAYNVDEWRCINEQLKAVGLKVTFGGAE